MSTHPFVSSIMGSQLTVFEINHIWRVGTVDYLLLLHIGRLLHIALT